MPEFFFFYTNARYGGKTALLAGPFFTMEEAEKLIDVLGPMFVQIDANARSASFGVMRCKKYAGEGLFNRNMLELGMVKDDALIPEHLIPKGEA